jgi:2,4-dienoyl-CoA reductase-like NADH-dependent reductase (Old Yellow Enzyme family)
VLERLFSPLRVGPVEVANRIVSTAHQTTLVHEHLPTEDLVAYHEARARGGAGLIVLEATAVHPSGLLTPHTLAGYRPEIVPKLARLAEAVHGHGTRLFVQLFHGGREQISSPPSAPALAPSAIPTPRFHVEPRALSAEEIDSIVDGFARSAELAAEAGQCLGQRLCEPCAHLERLTAKAGKPGTLRALIHKGGLRADVLSDGEIRVGDEITAR